MNIYKQSKEKNLTFTAFLGTIYTYIVYISSRVSPGKLSRYDRLKTTSRRKKDMRQTYMAKPSTVEKKWYVIDAEGQTLGRLSSEVASILRGKHKPTYTPHIDTGDNVIIINAEKIVLTGKKLTDKIYRRHTMHPGGLKERTAGLMVEKYPEELLELSIKGMLPKNTLGRAQGMKLHVYRGAEHPHAAQKPEKYELRG